MTKTGNETAAESFSPCCSSNSSGVSSCESDDDYSINSGFDDDGDDCDDSSDEGEDGKCMAKKWTTENGYVIKAFDQVLKGQWTKEMPLPLPLWHHNQKPTLIIDKIYAYEDIVAIIETTLQHMIQETHYDTVNNFIHFYRSFKNSHMNNLDEFFRSYNPSINRQNHMCVSLGMEIIARIAVLRPDLADFFYLVSCEEAVENAITYIDNCQQTNIDSVAWNLEKEHVLVAMRIRIGNRDGILLLDPGYHVARVVTIMNDEKYPHSGFFVQSDEPGCRREYCYKLSDKNFVTWHEKTTRNGEETHEESLIYVGRPFQSAIDVTARRNLVYEFRSLIARNNKGRVFAGLYFPILSKVNDSTFTIFYNEGINNKMVKTKIRFSIFKDETKIPDMVLCHLSNVASQLRMEFEQLIHILKTVNQILSDDDFVTQLLSINFNISDLSKDN